jgi:hypothetical protein
MSIWKSGFKELTKQLAYVDYSQLVCENVRCTENSTKKPTLWRRDVNYEELIWLKCEVCHVEWRVCKSCKIKKN